jgi:hypothetical protein
MADSWRSFIRLPAHPAEEPRTSFRKLALSPIRQGATGGDIANACPPSSFGKTLVI